MRLLPQKRWKRIVFVFLLVFLLSTVAILAYVGYAINSDVISEVEILNAAGSKAALIIYHPGLTSFMKEVTYAFGEGLVSNGWRVEITTSSSEAPTDLNAYDLLVLGTPVYGFRVTPTIERHLERMGDLKGIETVGILTAAGSIGDSASMIEQVVVDSNGNFLKAVILYSMAPNQNDASAMFLAEQAAKSLN